MNTQQKIANLLNKKDRTVNDLSEILGITRNSVHLQVSKLEAAGIIEKFQQKPQPGAGKPAFSYRTVAGHEDEFSSAYKSVLTGMIQTINIEMNEKDRRKLLEKTGRSIAKGAGLKPGADLSDDVQSAVDAVNALGAMAEITEVKKLPFVTCYSCPVGTLVYSDPLVCRLVAAFFSEATGRQVSMRCRHEGTLVCGFQFEKV